MCSALLATPPVRFAEHTIATGLKGGYQVVVADLNHDGRPDLIALASDLTELAWYENPGWQRHVIASNITGMINLAAWDMDGDGIPEIALASGFEMQAKNSAGIISLLRHHGDPRQPWSIREIDRVPASHRLRWADIDGDGHKVLINAPLTSAEVNHPDDHAHTPLYFYRPGAWKRELISAQDEGVLHGILIIDWDHDGRDEVLTASFSGIHLLKWEKNGHWSRTELAQGDPAAWPKCGSSDVAVGQLGGQRVVAAIEPWHGNQLVIYRQAGHLWQRHVIDSSISDGHTVLTADFNGDGADEVIAGYRGHGLNIYYAQDPRGEQWSKQVIDSTVSAAGCAIADLNSDGRPDIACIGTTTANLKWYENLGSPTPTL